MRRPALAGGEPAFPDPLPFARPLTPPLDQVVDRLRPSYESGQLTDGPLVRELEARVAEILGVAHVVAVSNCTTGLMLALHALGPRGPVVLPSFTFSASAHAVVWNGIRPRFAECTPDNFQLDVDDAAGRLDGAGALLATHVFGAPSPVERLEALARRRGVPLIFDAAHALGAWRGERRVGGFGDVEVFSLSPTKPVAAGEGGLVTTNRDDVAAAVRLGRGSGNPGDYNSRFAGLNGRMSELHAALALESLAMLPGHLERRVGLADRYRKGLSDLPGIRLQAVDDGDRSTWKDLTIAVDGAAFGLSRDGLAAALSADGIDTRRYFWPPVHRHDAYAADVQVDLPVTDTAASQVLSLPIFAALTDDDVDRVVEAVAAVQAHAEEIGAHVA
jgi:dTDP-4-amino-4,6-dideoxygalactose transaminase